MTVFVCSDGVITSFPDVASAVAAALERAAQHDRVGVDTDEARAREIAMRALPGMVLCRRDSELTGVDCYPLTATTALVRPQSGSSSRAPVARTLRSITPRATPLAPTTS